MFNKILASVDLADAASARNCVEIAASLAQSHGGDLHVLTVVPTYSMSIVGSYFADGQEKQALELARKALSQWLEAGEFDCPVKGHVATGTIYDEIVKTADKLDCDLIVLASHRPELSDYLLGPNAARVVRHARQSVFVVREDS